MDIDKSTVQKLDIIRYMGLWYEIARFDHRFERGLVGCSAFYTLLKNGKITVVNRGYEKSLTGKLRKNEGIARLPNPEEPGKLEVSFFLNFYSPYYVFELATDYRYALVGSRSNRYLWILCRTPQIAHSDLQFLLQRINERQYDIGKLIWVEQPKLG